MKAITVRQPWASLIAAGVKTIETRPRRTSWRGRVAIHAGAALYDRDDTERFAEHLGGPWPILPLGAVVASAVLTDCVPIINEADPTPEGPFVYADPGNFIQVHDGPEDGVPRYSEEEVHLGDFSPGRWALLLDDIAPTTRRCPWCWGDGCDPDQPSMPCPVCKSMTDCNPIPARGQQAVPWEWTP